MERNDYRARIAYVDYNGKDVYEHYQNKTPKTNSEKIEFVEMYAPKVACGIKMIERFFDDVKRKAACEEFGKISVNA